jgi:L-cysteine/cystine lyase
VLDKTRCTHVAAYSNTAFTMRGEKPDMGALVDSAHRFTYGSFCGPLWDGALKALEFYKIMDPAKIEERSKGLTTRLQQQLLELGNRIEMLTPTEDISRACQLGFRIKNGNEKASQEFVTKAREKNIILRYVGESNIDCVRVSTHYYNSEADTDAMMDELKKFIG